MYVPVIYYGVLSVELVKEERLMLLRRKFSQNGGISKQWWEQKQLNEKFYDLLDGYILQCPSEWGWDGRGVWHAWELKNVYTKF